MAKKIKLDSAFDYDDLTIIGINCTLPDYRFIWHLNNKFNFNLIKYDDFGIDQSNEVVAVRFSFYQYHDVENFKKYYFLANKNQNKFLINEYKDFNFLFMIEGTVNDLFISDLLKKIKSIKNVLLTITLDLTKVKQLDLILHDFEMFTFKINKNKK